jgi:hypothetical protein
MSVISKRALVWIARIGFIGRGLVFLLLGALALWSALTGDARPVGTSGAMNIVLSEPAGRVFALAVAAGLLCFAALRIVEAIDDVYGYGDDLRGLAQRASLGFAGLFYTGLGIAAASIVLSGEYAPDNDVQVRDWTAWALSAPLGQWLVAAAGVVVASIGIGLAAAGFGARFKTRLMQWKDGSRLVMLLGAVGFVARSVVFILIGCFLIFAAWEADPRQAEGFGGALRTLHHLPYGNALLLAAAAGLVAFGLFGVAEARYGRATQRRG